MTFVAGLMLAVTCLPFAMIGLSLLLTWIEEDPANQQPSAH